jgi:hypothetical protein
MNCRFCGHPAVEQTFTQEPVCEVHATQLLIKMCELIDKASFMCSVVDDINDLTRID